MKKSFILPIILALLTPGICHGWGNEGHKLINRIAIESLPPSVPTFLRTPEAIDEIEFLGPEPDRWRSEHELHDATAPEHFINLESADAAYPEGLPPGRFQLLDTVARAQAHHRETGQLPWQVNEDFERLRQDMREYRARLAAHQSPRSVEQAILYDIGILGHFVGDGSQPLHTTIDYNGWVEEENPEHFSSDPSIHNKFETQFVRENIRTEDVRGRVPTSPHLLADPFQDVVRYLRTSHTHVKEIYRLEKQGAFEAHGTPQSRGFTAERLAAGAAMLRDMILTAWHQSQTAPQP